jgi:glycosyltransferase involved in cell wall biosynthesis
MKEKIAILTSAHLASDVRIYEKEARSLAKQYDVTLIAPVHVNFTPDDVAYIPLKLYQSRIMRGFNVIKCFFAASRVRPRIVHFHDPELLPTALLLRWLLRVKIVYDIHENQHKGILNKEWLPVWFRSIILFCFSTFESFALRWMNGIILAEFSYLHTYDGKSSNIQVVRNYPILINEVFDTSERKVNVGNRFTIGYVGAIQKERGIIEMIELVRELKKTSSRSFSLEIMGSFASEQLKNEVHGLIRSYDLEEHINFHGRLPYRRFLLILANADVGLVFLHPTPANKEIIPTKLFEYIMLQIPIIVMDIPILKDFVNELGCGIVVNAFDPGDTAKRILELADDPERRRVMGRNGFEGVRKKYNWEHEEKKLFKLYKNL